MYRHTKPPPDRSCCAAGQTTAHPTHPMHLGDGNRDLIGQAKPHALDLCSRDLGG